MTVRRQSRDRDKRQARAEDRGAPGSIGRSRSWLRFAELDHGTNVASWIEHHVPGQVGDLTGAQASLGGQQDDHTVTEGMSGAACRKPGGR